MAELGNTLVVWVGEALRTFEAGLSFAVSFFGQLVSLFRISSLLSIDRVAGEIGHTDASSNAVRTQATHKDAASITIGAA
jgi:hypothetical protein